MDKNNKKDTIKEILNNKKLSDDSKISTNNNEDSIINQKEDNEQIDSNNNVNTIRESSIFSESSNNSGNTDTNGVSNNTNTFFIDIAVLNELSKSCQMAMSNISYLSNSISDKDMKKNLVAIYSQYANILLQVDQHFEKYGEIPENISHSIKMMGICGLRMNLRFDKSTSHIAEIMIQGENMGIIKCQKILNCNYDIQNSTIKLLEKFRDFQKDNIIKLNEYL